MAELSKMTFLWVIVLVTLGSRMCILLRRLFFSVCVSIKDFIAPSLSLLLSSIDQITSYGSSL
jgi:hypothetical protein